MRIQSKSTFFSSLIRYATVFFLIGCLSLSCESKEKAPIAPAVEKASVEVTNQLAEFVDGITYTSLSEQTIQKAKWAILDAVACGIAANNDPPVNILRTTMQEMGSQGGTPVFGKSDTYSGHAAAFINGTMICALDFDDTHSFSSVHAGGPVVSAAISALYARDSLHIDGKKFLTAVVAGYEVSCRIGMGMRGNDPYARGFHPTAINGTFGAATASGKLLGLNSDEIKSAWGISGSSTGGLMSYLQNGAFTKKFHSGNAAQSGFTASMLASNEYLGPNKIFDGRYNFTEAYANEFDGKKVLDQLGERFEIERMSYKRFPSCRTNQVPVTAVMDMFKSGEKFNPEDITKIKAIVANEDIGLVLEPLPEKKNPTTVVQAQFSMPYSVALALVEKDLSIELYEKALAEDQETSLVNKLSNLFEYTTAEKYTIQRPEYFPCELQIEFKDGTMISKTVKAPMGDFHNALQPEEHRKKIVQIVEPILGSAKTEDFIKQILNLENLSADEIKNLLESLH